MDTFAKKVGILCTRLFVIVFGSLVLCFPVMWTVNSLFTSEVINGLFGVPQLTLWKAFWLNILCGLLFKGSSSDD